MQIQGSHSYCLRKLVLRRIYDLADRTCKKIEFRALFESFEEDELIDKNQVYDCIDYLGKASLLENEITYTTDKSCTMYLNTSITVKGIAYLEGANPGEYSASTQPPMITIENIIGSQIALGNNNTQYIHSDTPELDKILKLVDDLIAKMPDESTLTMIKEAIIQQKEEGQPSKTFLGLIKNQLLSFVVQAGVNLAKYGLCNAFGI